MSQATRIVFVIMFRIVRTVKNCKIVNSCQKSIVKISKSFLLHHTHPLIIECITATHIDHTPQLHLQLLCLLQMLPLLGDGCNVMMIRMTMVVVPMVPMVEVIMRMVSQPLFATQCRHTIQFLCQISPCMLTSQISDLQVTNMEM